MNKKGRVLREAQLVRTIRDVAGIIGLIGVGILGGFALTNLKPGWEWTQQDAKEPEQKTTGSEQ